MVEVGEFKRAEEVLIGAVIAEPELFQAWLNLGNAFKEQAKDEKAILSYRKALEIKNDFAEAYYSLGNVLTRVGQLDEAIENYQKAIKFRPDFDRAYFALGLVLKKLGRPDEAIVNYRKSIECKPDFVDALSQLAIELNRKKEYDEAIVVYKRALILDPEHLISVSGLGWCFLHSGKQDEAVEYYADLLLQSPYNTDALFFLFEIVKGKMWHKLQQDFSYSSNFLKKYWNSCQFRKSLLLVILTSSFSRIVTRLRLIMLGRLLRTISRNMILLPAGVEMS